MSGAVREAHRRLAKTGIAPYPLAEGLAALAEIAEHLGTDDPLEIGAGYLLELEGCERSRQQLRLDLGAQGEPEMDAPMPGREDRK
jgi:hypothetical protein